MAAPARAAAPSVGLWAQAWSLEAPGLAARRPPGTARAAAVPRFAAVPGTAPALPQPQPAPGAPIRRPNPRPVATPARRGRSSHTVLPLLLVSLVACAFLLAPLLLNVAAMRGEWQLGELQQQEDDLLAQRASLRARVAALSSTQRIEEQAVALGLTPTAPVDYLFLNARAGADSATATGEAAASGG